MIDVERAILDFKKFKQAGYGHGDLPSSWSIELAIAALQEKLAREQGCECCLKSEYGITASWATEDRQGISITNHSKRAVLCPVCGKRLGGGE